MSKLPVVPFRTMEKLLLKLGFSESRQRGSHHFYRHPDGRTTTLPQHGNVDLSRPLIREILRQIEISPDNYIRLLDEL